MAIALHLALHESIVLRSRNPKVVGPWYQG
jgi:hypothetical protein